MATVPLLSVERILAGYGDLRVLWDVSLTVSAGSVSLLLGRNGAGKTTTLRAIAGLNKLSGGDVRFKGESLAGVSPSGRVRRGLAYVQEGRRVFRRRTVEENLLLGGYTVSKSRRVLAEACAEVYETFPILGSQRKKRAGELSGGQQQMLAIGQALMVKPSLIMLDEPSGGLAPSVYKEVMVAVDLLRRRDVGILLVEQAVESSLAFADVVTVLDVGRVTISGDARRVSPQDLIRSAYFGTSRT